MYSVELNWLFIMSLLSTFISLPQITAFKYIPGFQKGVVPLGVLHHGAQSSDGCCDCCFDFGWKAYSNSQLTGNHDCVLGVPCVRSPLREQDIEYAGDIRTSYLSDDIVRWIVLVHWYKCWWNPSGYMAGYRSEFLLAHSLHDVVLQEYFRETADEVGNRGKSFWLVS